MAWRMQACRLYDRVSRREASQITSPRVDPSCLPAPHDGSRGHRLRVPDDLVRPDVLPYLFTAWSRPSTLGATVPRAVMCRMTWVATKVPA